jgi:hypothetical protein
MGGEWMPQLGWEREPDMLSKEAMEVAPNSEA